MAQKTETNQDTGEDKRQSGARDTDKGQDRPADQRRQDEARQMEEAAGRMGNAAREEARSGGQVLRRAGQESEERAAETGRNLEQGMQRAGQTARRDAERMGDRTREMAEFGADQFDRMGEMMAEAARDAAETARLMMRFGGFQTGGARSMQVAAGGLVDRMLQTQMDMVQRMMGPADAVGFAASQQRLLRRFLESWAEGSADMLRATRQSVDQALVALDKDGEGRQGGRGRRQGREEGREQGGQQDQEEETVGDLMHRGLRTIGPDQPIREAASIMAEEDTGVLPVMEGDRLIGMVTDRDIAIRLAGEGKDPAKTKVREVMSGDIVTCQEDDPAEAVLERMADEQLHRLPVVDGQGKPVGIISLADLVGRMPEQTGQALRGIDRRDGRHSQRQKSQGRQGRSRQGRGQDNQEGRSSR